MTHRRFILIPFSLLFFCTLYAQQGVISRQSSASNPVIQNILNEVSADSLMKTVKALQALGTRYEYTPQRDSAAEYLLREFRRLGLQAESEWFSFSSRVFYDLDFVDSTTGWIVGSSGTVLTTTNGGATWQHLPPPVPPTLLAVDFLDTKTGWIAGSGGKIYATTNGGTYWTQQASTISSDINDIAFVTENLGVAACVSGGILRTTDGGVHWVSINANTSASLQEIEWVDSSVAWIAGSGILLRTTDGGATWVKIVSGTTSNYSGIDFVDDNTGWVVGSGPVVLKSTDRGSTWVSQVTPAGAGTILKSVRFSDALHGWIVDRDGGVLKTTDGGQSWRQALRFPPLSYRPELQKIKSVGNGRLFLCGSRCNVWRSFDDGENWISQPNALPPSLNISRNVVVTLRGTQTPENEYIICGHYDSYISGSSGNANLIAPGANDNASGTSAVVEAARILRNHKFASTIRFVAFSAEELGLHGGSFHAFHSVFQKRQTFAVLNGDMIAIATRKDTLIINCYQARNWVFDSIAVFSQRYALGWGFVLGNGGSSDHVPFTNAGIPAVHFFSGIDPYYHKVSDTSGNLDPTYFKKAAQLMIATLAELAKPLETSISVPDPVVLPSSFALDQNFPNPFNPSTTFQFALPRTERVSVRVFDLLGREVATVFSGELDAGVHRRQWDGSALPSGVYFYRLQAGDFMDTKKLIVLQ